MTDVISAPVIITVPSAYSSNGDSFQFEACPDCGTVTISYGEDFIQFDTAEFMAATVLLGKAIGL